MEIKIPTEDLSKTLEKLSTSSEKEILGFFKKKPLFTLIHQIPGNHEKTALDLLALLDKLAQKNIKHLKKLFFGKENAQSPSGERYNLMQKMNKFTRPVIVKALQLMMRLSPSEREEILLSHLNPQNLSSPSSILTMPFYTISRIGEEEKINMAIDFINILQQHRDKSATFWLPYFLLLEQKGWNKAIFYYLEETALPLPDGKWTALRSLLNPWDLSTFQAILKKHPELINQRLSKKNTLVHLAVQTKNIAALRVLIALDADVNKTNQEGKRALDEIIQREDWDGLGELIAHDKTDFISPGFQGRFPLASILGKVDYFKFKEILAKILQDKDKQKIAASLGSALVNLPKTPLIVPGLEEALQTSIRLQDYCQQNQDIPALFLVNAAEFFSNFSNSDLGSKEAKPYPDLQNFVLMRLDNLVKLRAIKAQSDSNNLEIAMEQRVLNLFLSALAPQTLLELVDKLSFNSEQYAELEKVLCKVLLKPSMLSKLGLEAYCLQSHAANENTPLQKTMRAWLQTFSNEERELPLQAGFLREFYMSLARDPLVMGKAENQGLFRYLLSTANAAEVQQILAHLPGDHALNPLNPQNPFNPQVDTETQKQTSLCLFKSINSVMLARNDRDTLFNSWTNYVMHAQCLLPKAVLLQESVPLIRCFSPENLVRFNKEQKEVLKLYEKAEFLIKGMSYQSSLNAMLEWFLYGDEEDLKACLSLSQQSHLTDLEQFLQSILSAKKQHKSIYQLKASLPRSQLQWPKLKEILHQQTEALTASASLSLSLRSMIDFLYRGEEGKIAHLLGFSELLEEHTLAPSHETIILFFQTYQSELDKDLLSEPSQEFVAIFSKCFSKISEDEQEKILLALEDKPLKQLLEHCLSGLGSHDPMRAASCRRLLQCICRRKENEARGKQIDMLYQYLSLQDLDFLGNATLKSLAEDVLKESNSMEDAVYQGVWIHRLLLSPKFVAGMKSINPDNPPAVYHSLVERLRYLSLMLKIDESESLDRAIKDKQGRFYKSQHLQNKNEAAKRFQISKSIIASGNQLFRECSQETDDPELQKIRDEALKTYQAYITQQLHDKQYSLSFRMANFLYATVLESKGDVETAKNPLLQWLNDHCDHKTLVARELEKHLLDDSMDDENVFQWESSALILKTMPIELLERKKEGLKLLVKDVFRKNALSVLFKDVQDRDFNSEKNQWLRKHLADYLAQMQKPLTKLIADDPTFFADFVHHQDIQTLLSLLKNCKNTENAKGLYDAMMQNQEKMEALFTYAGAEELKHFFTKIKADKALADYLLAHWKSPSLYKGLKMFASLDMKDLLYHALNHLMHDLEESQFDKIMEKLIVDEAVARVVLEGFLHDKQDSDLPEEPPESHRLLCQHFSKQHIVSTIRSLNQQNTGHMRFQYRLLLSIFHIGKDELLQSMEARMSKFAWTPDELQEVTTLMKHYFRRNPDSPLLKTFLPDLLLRIANAGQPDLFYHSPHKLNKKFVEWQFKRSSFAAFAARFCFIDMIKTGVEEVLDACKNLAERVMHWLIGAEDPAENKAILQELEKQKAAVDWKKMAKMNWQGVEGTKLPMINVFLLHYSGDTLVLETFLNDIWDNIFKKPECLDDMPLDKNLLYVITDLMASYPQRDVSKVIFRTLEKRLVDQSDFLDAIIFQNMVDFYAKQNKNEIPYEAEKKLLTHFGQKKFYNLTKQAAALLQQRNTKVAGLSSLTLEKVANEAFVEEILRPYTKGIFFVIIRALTRFLHGTNGCYYDKTTIVTYCHDKKPAPSEALYQFKPKITTPQAIGGQEWEALIRISTKREEVKEYQKNLREEMGMAQPLPRKMSSSLFVDREGAENSSPTLIEGCRWMTL